MCPAKRLLASFMTLIGNTRDRYGAMAVALHWLMAALLVVLAALGLYMVRLPDAGFDKTKVTLILYHKELGMLALALTALRLGWRVGNVLPRLMQSLPDWQQVAARFVHLNFYALMVALPISGWLMSSADGIPVSFLGLFQLPDVIDRDPYLFQVLLTLHKWLGYGLVALLCVHAGAALWHHFIARDQTLRSMLPRSGSAETISASARKRTPRHPAVRLP
jgi:cytochrome b561